MEEGSLWLPAASGLCSLLASGILLGRSYKLLRSLQPSNPDSLDSPLLVEDARRSSGSWAFWFVLLPSASEAGLFLYTAFLIDWRWSIELAQLSLFIVAWGAAFLLALLEDSKSRGLPGPFLPWWWGVSACISCASAWKDYQEHNKWESKVIAFVISGLLSLLLILTTACTSRGKESKEISSKDSGSRKEAVNKYDSATFLSRLTFWYILDLLKLGYKRPLQPSDVPPLPKSDDPEAPTNRFQIEWANERRKEKPSLLKALFQVYGARVALQAIPCFLAEVGSLACPLLLQRVLTYLTADSAEGESKTNWRALQYALAFFAFTMMRSVGTHTMWMQLMQVSIQCKYTLIAALYSKVLRMPPAGKGKHSGGKVQNLVASDVDAITRNVLPFVQWWTVSLVMNTVLPGFFLYRLVGPAYLIGISVLLVLLPVSVWVAGIVKHVTKAMYEARDSRVKLLGEVIRSILVVKCLAWDDLMLTWLTSKRERELALRFRLIWWDLSEVLLWDAVPAAVPLVTFAWYCLWMRQQLTIVTAFTTIAWLDILQMNVNYIPWIYRSLINASVSYHRIQDFLLGPELPPLQSLPPESHLAVELRNADLGWSSESHQKKCLGEKNRGAEQPTSATAQGSEESSGQSVVLHDINLTVQRGEFVAIVGPVGSGKSTLLSTISNGGALCLSGNIAISASAKSCLALVGEEPWVQNASVKENITFGAPFDEIRFAEVLEACQLAADVSTFGTAGADAIVGDRGATLSGGQRARCALARACYRRAETDLYVLDDCLRGLDVHVSRAVFEKCLLGYLDGKTRVVATHDEKLIEAADRIVLLEGGTCREVTVEEWQEIAGGQEWQETEGGRSEKSDSATSEGEQEEIDEQDGESDNDADDSEDEASNDVDALLSRGASDELCLSPRAAALLAMRASREANGENRAQVDLRTPLLGTGGGAGPSKPPPKKPPVLRPPVIKKGDHSGQESKREGAVSVAVFSAFFRAMGGSKIVLPALVVFAFRIAANISRTLWLAVWTGTGAHAQGAQSSQLYYIKVYAAIVLTVAILAALRTLLAYFGCFFASKHLHAQMLRAVLRAPMALFHRTSAGTIINRFSSDTGQMDDEVPEELSGFIEVVLQLLGAIFIVSYSTPIFLLLLAFLSLFFVAIAQLYRFAARDLKRIQSLRQSPLYSHFAESMEGAPCARAFGESARFISDGKARVAAYLAATFSAWAANQFVTLWMDAMGAAVMLGATFLAMVASQRGSLRPEMAALSITYAAEFAELLMWSVRQWTELEVAMVAVERVLDYTDLPSEAWGESPSTSSHKKLPGRSLSTTSSDEKLLGGSLPGTNWPEQGRLEFEDVWLVYEARSRGSVRPTGPQKQELSRTLSAKVNLNAKAALRGIRFAASPGERIAVVGRTGAGKSSLVSALFRLVELATGHIYIDGVDIAHVSLSRLRSSLAVVPQEPVLFSGSLRTNLDPRGIHTDHEIWEALEAVALKDRVGEKEKRLEEEVGGNFSLGERQLICVARALLHGAKITVLDEASSAVDSASEGAIYRALLWRPGINSRVFGSSGHLPRPQSVQSMGELTQLQDSFYRGTVLYIAHKLSTVLLCDRVIVMDSGRIVEMDSPANLLARDGSIFAGMVESAN